MNDEQQLELARQLRAELAAVITDEHERTTAESELDEALAMSGGERDRRLTEVLSVRAETREWMRDHDADPERIGELGGGPTAELGTYFVCPKEDFEFVRETVDQPVPVCPRHKLALRRVAG